MTNSRKALDRVTSDQPSLIYKLGQALEEVSDRDEETAALIKFGFKQIENRRDAKPGDIILLPEESSCDYLGVLRHDMTVAEIYMPGAEMNANLALEDIVSGKSKGAINMDTGPEPDEIDDAEMGARKFAALCREWPDDGDFQVWRYVGVAGTP